jgi:hypothetical protein
MTIKITDEIIRAFFNARPADSKGSATVAGLEAVAPLIIAAHEAALKPISQADHAALQASVIAENVVVPQALFSELLGVTELRRHPAFPDPQHHERVKALGREIGFGAMMATAEAGWREVNEEKGNPKGSEFVAGPCRSTVDALLRMIDEYKSRLASEKA